MSRHTIILERGQGRAVLRRNDFRLRRTFTLNNRITSAWVVIALLWLGVVAGAAQQAQEFTVKDIVIEGLHEVALGPVMDQVGFKAGDTISVDDVRQSAQRIFGMGLFRNVEPQPKEEDDGVVLTFRLEENPVLRAIEISGNKEYQIGWDWLHLKIPFFFRLVKSSAIVALLKDNDVVPGKIVNVNDLKSALKALQTAYTDQGYTLFQIDEKQVMNSIVGGDVLRIPIVEFLIEEVRIEGLDPEMEALARKMILIPQDQPAKAFQVQKTLSALTNSVYFQVAPGDSVQPLPGSKVDRLVLSFHLLPRTLLEQPVALDNIVFEGNTVYSNKRLQARLQSWDKTQPLDNLGLLHVLRGAFNLYHQHGYTRTQFALDTLSDGTLKLTVDEGKIRNLSVKLNYEAGYTQLNFPAKGPVEARSFELDEAGKSVEVEDTPNHTRPYVIKKSLFVHANSVFNEDMLRDSVRTLLGLGYFDDVQVGVDELGENAVDVTLNVVEKKKLGSLNGALSWSDNGLVGQLNLSEKNLLGTGQDLSLEFKRGIFGSAQTNWSLNYQTNGFFPEYKDFGAKLFQSFERPSFEQELSRAGGELSLSYPLTSGVDLLLSGRHENFQECQRDGVNCDAPGVTDSVTLGLSNDTRDNPTFPMEGGRHLLQVEKAGGFSVGSEFTKVQATFIHHFFVAEKQNVSLRLFGGWIGGKDRPAQDRFSFGGPSSVRGRVSKQVDTVGYFNLEYRTQWLDQFSTALFSDWGVTSNQRMAWTVGLELRIQLPVLPPVRIILAYPLNDPNYRTFAPSFQFAFGNMF